MLAVNNLAYCRNDQYLFKNLSFLLNPGSALQVTGNNGVGKTTLLRIIVGLIKPTLGAITYDYNHSICYIGHQHNLHTALTPLQNLRFLQGLSNQSDSLNFNILQGLDYFGLHNKVNIKSDELSAGQLQRVSLARLYNNNAKIWVLDEPLANLDDEAVALFLQLSSRHLNDGGVLIAATHKLLDLSFCADILRLQDYSEIANAF